MSRKHKFIILLCFGAVLGAAVWFASPSLVSASAPGALVRNPKGAIFLIQDGQRLGFPSVAILFSHGYSFQDAVLADEGDLALPEGFPFSYRDGALVKDHGQTVYIISDGQKRPFSSAEAFLGLGYSFKNILQENGTSLARILPGPTVDSAGGAHPDGTLVNDNGTVYLIAAQAREGIPSLEVFNWYRYQLKNIVPINDSDRLLPVSGILGIDNTLTPVSAPSPPSTPTSIPESTPPPVQTGNHAPSAPLISGVIATFPQTTETFKFSSTDADGDALTYSIDWGDGSVLFATAAASGTTFSATHVWVNVGTYQITASVSDGKGGAASSSAQLQVANDAGSFGPAVTVLAPNGGETFALNQPILITWKRNWAPPGSGKKVDIYYSRAGINVSITTKVADGSYTWVPVGLTPATNYRIVILSQGSAGTNNAILSDQSDGDFTITSQVGY